MTGFRFSLARLLVGVVIPALLLATLRAFATDASAWTVALGGLNLCTLCFALLCAVMGRSVTHTLLLGSAFYCWGLACLLMGEVLVPTGWLRMLLAAGGVFLSVGAWLGLPPPPELPNA